VAPVSAKLDDLSSRRLLVSSLAATTTVGYGVLFYAYGVLLLPMEAGLGWRRSTLTGAFTCALVVSALLTIPVGRWLDRHQPRPLLTFGAVAATVLVGLWAWSDSTVVFYAVWIGLGACMATLFYEPAFTILTKRLRGPDRHRAITSVTLLAGLASTIFGPLTAFLERSLGWRGAIVSLAAILGVVTIPLFVLSLRPSPSDEDPAAPHHTDTAPREAMRSPRFWGLTTAYLLSAVATFAIAVHLVPYLRGEGWTSGSAATVLGGVGLVQVLGRSIFGRLTLRWSAGSLGTWVLGSKAIGIAVLTLWPTVAGVLVFLVVYGAANGLQTLTRATVVADLYGAAHYGSISAVMSAICSIAGSFAPFAVATAIEIVGADEPVLWGLAGVALVSAVANELAISGRPSTRSLRRLSDVDAVPDLET
jgi:MFS family permease